MTENQLRIMILEAERLLNCLHTTAVLRAEIDECLPKLREDHARLLAARKQAEAAALVAAETFQRLTTGPIEPHAFLAALVQVDNALTTVGAL